MTGIYNKDKLAFSLILIGAYVLLASIADSLSDAVGISKIITVPFLFIMSLAIYIFLSKNKLKKEYGLILPLEKASTVLFYIPLIILITANLWNGVTLNMSVTDTVLYILSMLFVGFIEEIIFRGFLFKALCNNGIKKAFIISSLTFGIGHIVNLFNGASLLPTVLQIISAVAIGFMFTLIFYKSKSLLPCIVTHSVFNSLSAFGREPDSIKRIIFCIAICAICVLYSLYLIKSLKRSNSQ